MVKFIMNNKKFEYINYITIKIYNKYIIFNL